MAKISALSEIKKLYGLSINYHNSHTIIILFQTGSQLTLLLLFGIFV